MSEHTGNAQDPPAGDGPAGRSDRPSNPRLRHQRDLEDIRRLTEELTRRQETHPDPTPAVSSARRNRSDWRVVYSDTAGTQTVLPPIEDLMSRSNDERTRSTGYRRPQDNATARDDRRNRLSSILPPLPDNSDEAVDIEITNQRMMQTEDGDLAGRYRTVNSRFGTATDLEILLGGDEEDEVEFARARYPSRLRHSATATTTPAAGNTASDDAAITRDMDPNERRWIETLYMRFPPEVRNSFSPRVRAVLNQRREREAGRLDSSGRDALWNMMMQENQSDEGEGEGEGDEEESEWEVTSSPGEMSRAGATRHVGDLLADLAALDEMHEAARSLPPAPLTPSRPATNAHLRGTHVPLVVGRGNRAATGTRTTARGDVRADRGEGGSRMDPTESGAGLHRRKSIKRRRIEAGVDVTHPYPIMTSTNSEPISTQDLPEYMRIISTPIFAIPTSFNPLDKCVRLSLSPSVSADAVYGDLVVVKFTGTGARGDADAAAVRSNQPIPNACGIYYYEATIVSKGKEGFISIGFSNRMTNLSRLVGWEPGSFAWHMDDGFVFEGRGEGISKGWPTSTTGDVIGCGIDFTTGQAFFTKNGQFIGSAFKNVGHEDKLYPSIGLRTPGETVECNFKGPFKYDIVDHVRKAQRELVAQVLRKEYVKIKAPGGPHSEPKGNATASSTVPNAKSCKATTVQKSTSVPASPQKVIRNIDGAMAPAVLSYLQHNGFLGSASAMRKDMNSRKRLLETGLGESDQARQSKVAKTEKWYEAQESCWRELQKVKTDYAENRMSSVWNDLRDGSGPAIGCPQFLESGDGLWACRIRIRYFYKLILESLRKADEEVDVASNTTTLPGLSGDIDFNQFIFGETGVHLNPSDGSDFDTSTVLLAVGRNLRAKHGQSSNEVVKQAVETALSYMPYTRLSDLPSGMYKRISEAARAQEAEELIKAIRDHQGKPASSALDEAFVTSDRILVDLGRAHNVASAAFLSVGQITRGRV